MDISSMLEVQVKEETDVKENVTPGREQASSTTGTATSSISQEEYNYYKLTFGNDIASVRFRRIHCTACDVHIGSAPAQSHNMFEHPILRTLLCAHCHDFYGDGSFEQGDDATDMFCRWCANGGNLYCCSYCSNTFCYRCIRRNFSSLVRKKIEADEKWKCFVCNPSDLYSARALCWALLQHVQTLTRILSRDKKMSAREIEEKVNLDETTCCSRRSKRKRRRPESNSEDEDVTCSPRSNGVPVYVKRKLRKRKPINRSIDQAASNGIDTREVQIYRPPIPIRPRPTSFPSDQSCNAKSNSANNQKNSINPESIVIPSSSRPIIRPKSSLPSRLDPNTLQQRPSLYHASFMNTSGSTTYIQTPVTMNSTTRIILPPQSQSQLYRSQQTSSYQSQQMSSYQLQQASAYQPQQASSYQPQQPSSYRPQQASSSQPRQTNSNRSRQTRSRQTYPTSLQSSLNTMVSIPNPVDKLGRPVLLFPKAKDSNIILTPNIIEIDSDSDDDANIVGQQNNTIINENDSMDISSNRVVPVALTWENSDDDIVREEQSFREISATVKKNVSFSEIMLPHSRELDELLSSTKEKMYNLFDLNNATPDNIKMEAQQRIKSFHSNMHDTVFQLVGINDRIVRQYGEWKKSQNTETEASSSSNENALTSQENVDLNISLDMICVNDSDTESEHEDQKCEVLKPSDLIKDSNIIKYLLSSKTNVVHRGVGDDNAHLITTDKAIQVYDNSGIVLRDYEESISYFKFAKTDQNPKTDDSVKSLLVKFLSSDKNFSKYEEQFISYLQTYNIENKKERKRKGVEIKKSEKEENPSKLSSQEVIQTDPLFISHLLQDNDLFASTDQTKNSPEKNLNDDINSVTKDDENDTHNNSEEIINSTINIQETTMQLHDKLQQIEPQKTHADMTNEETIVSDTNNDNLNKNDNIINTEVVASTGSEKDCTINND